MVLNMSTESLARKERSTEADRDRILEQAERSPGIAEVMRLYDAAEASYRAAVRPPEVRVASSTNLRVRAVDAKLG